MSFTVFADKKDWYAHTAINDRGLLVTNHYEFYRIHSTAFVDPYVAEGQLGLTPFAIHGSDPNARVIDVRTTVDPSKANPWVYLSAVTYSTASPAPTQQDRLEDNPLDDEPEIEIDGEPTLYPMYRDRDGKLIANSAGQPIGGVFEERSIEIAVITRNEPYRNTTRDRIFRGRVNLYGYSGASPGQLKMYRISASRQYRNQVLFWRYRYEIRFNEKGWQPSVLNAGTKQKNSDGNLVDCVDDENQPVAEPVPLDSSGKQIPSASLPDAANDLTFNTLIAADFAQLGLPIQ